MRRAAIAKRVRGVRTAACADTHAFLFFDAAKMRPSAGKLRKKKL
jgi:hypothetical protein